MEFLKTLGIKEKNFGSSTGRKWNETTDQGELKIYRWDQDKLDWIECPTFLVEMKNLPHGRVTCIMTAFGTYGIATAK